MKKWLAIFTIVVVGYITYAWAQHITAGGSGVFTGSQYNSYMTDQVGGINNGAEFSTAQGGLFATDALSTGITAPSSSSKHNIDSFAAYMVCDVVSSPLGGNNNCATIFSNMRMTRSGSAAWAINPGMTDTAGMTGHSMIGFELDTAIKGSPTALVTFLDTGFVGAAGVIPGAAAYGSFCGPPTAPCASLMTFAHTLANGQSFPVGIEFSPGEVSGDIFRSPPTCSSGTCETAAYAMTSYSSSVAKVAQIRSGFGAPGGNCFAGSIYLNSNPADASHVLYVCAPANTWTAITVP